MKIATYLRKRISLFCLIAMMCAFFAGCGSLDCIEVGGGYNGATGNVRICFNDATTKALGVPAFNDAAGKSYIMISGDDAAKLNAAIDQGKVTEEGAKAAEVTPNMQFKKLLKTLQAK